MSYVNVVVEFKRSFVAGNVPIYYRNSSPTVCNIGRILTSAGLGFFTQMPLSADYPFPQRVFGFLLESGRPHEELLRSYSLSYTVEHSI